MTGRDERRSPVRVLSGFGAFGLFWGSWGAALPAVQSHAGVDDSGLGIALALIGLGALVTMRLTGHLLDRFGRPLVVAVMGAFGVAGFLPAVAHGLLGFSVAAVVLGATSGAMDVSINAVAVDHEAGSGTRILNTSHGIFSICVVLSSLSVAGLRSLNVPSWTLLLGTQSVIVLLAAVVMPSRAPWHERRDGPALPDNKADNPRRTGRAPTALVVLGGLGAAAYLLENAWQSWGAILLQQDKGASAGVSALAPAVFAAMAAGGRLLGDPLARLASPRVLLAGGAAVAAAGSLLAAHAPDPALAIIGIAVAGFGTSVCAPTVIGLAGQTVTRLSRAAAVSTVTTLSYLGFLIGPPLVGLVAGHTNLPTALTVIGVEAALLAVAALTVRGLPADGTSRTERTY